MSKRKILFGAVDIGWRIELYSKFIIENFEKELVPYSVVYYKTPSFQYKTRYDYEFKLNEKNKLIDWFIRIIFFVKVLFVFDILYFISGETLLTRRLRASELKVYKLLGKKVFFHFVGSDIRSPRYIDWKTNNIQEFLKGKDIDKSEKWQKNLVRDANKYAEQIFVSTPDLKSIVNNSTYIPVFIDIEKFNNEIDGIKVDKDKNIIYILHAPSNKRLKGTIYIEKVLNKIKEVYNKDVELILPNQEGSSTYSLTRYELFKLYLKADIVIDQMIIGWYGLQAIEALLMDTIVISYIDKNLEPYLFDNCPIINADINTLETVVRDSIIRIQSDEINYDTQRNWVADNHTIDLNNTFFDDL